MSRWLLVLGIVIASSAGCSRLTMDPARSRRVSDCLAQCEAQQPPPQAMSAPDDPKGGPTQSSCEQRCHALR